MAAKVNNPCETLLLVFLVSVIADDLFGNGVSPVGEVVPSEVFG